MTAFNFGGGLVSAATNSDFTNVLFRVLLNEFAPDTRQPKYFRLNFDDIDLKTSTKGLENYVSLADLNDASSKAVSSMESRTKAWIKSHDHLITQAAQALKRSSVALA